MSAHRLISALLFLQARGNVTAGEMAAHLEVSERTARRDLEALAISGIPVYSQAGRGGGWSLLGGARTDLSGLTAAEARALFLVAGPEAAASPAVKAALRKLVRALPEPFRDDAESAMGSVAIDPRRWGSARRGERPPMLAELQQAVLDQRRVAVRYRDKRGAASERAIGPLGVVSKSGVWYLVADTDHGRRTFRVDRVESVAPAEGRVERPAGFDLDAAWQAAVDQFEQSLAGYPVELAIDPAAAGLFTMFARSAVEVTGTTADGRVLATMRAAAPRQAAVQVAGFGAAVEVLGPPEVRDLLAAVGRQLAATYG